MKPCNLMAIFSRGKENKCLNFKLIKKSLEKLKESTAVHSQRIWNCSGMNLESTLHIRSIFCLGKISLKLKKADSKFGFLA